MQGTMAEPEEKPGGATSVNTQLAQGRVVGRDTYMQSHITRKWMDRTFAKHVSIQVARCAGQSKRVLG